MENEIDIEIGILESIIKYLRENSNNQELIAKKLKQLRNKKIDDILGSEDDNDEQ